MWNRTFSPSEFQALTEAFDNGARIEVSDRLPSSEYTRQASELPNLSEAVRKLGAAGSPDAVASAVEFVLEGLHLNRRLNKDRVDGVVQYKS